MLHTREGAVYTSPMRMRKQHGRRQQDRQSKTWQVRCPRSYGIVPNELQAFFYLLHFINRLYLYVVYCGVTRSGGATYICRSLTQRQLHLPFNYLTVTVIFDLSVYDKNANSVGSRNEFQESIPGICRDDFGRCRLGHLGQRHVSCGAGSDWRPRGLDSR